MRSLKKSLVPFPTSASLPIPPQNHLPQSGGIAARPAEPAWPTAAVALLQASCKLTEKFQIESRPYCPPKTLLPEQDIRNFFVNSAAADDFIETTLALLSTFDIVGSAEDWMHLGIAQAWSMLAIAEAPTPRPYSNEDTGLIWHSAQPGLWLCTRLSLSLAPPKIAWSRQSKSSKLVCSALDFRYLSSKKSQDHAIKIGMVLILSYSTGI